MKCLSGSLFSAVNHSEEQRKTEEHALPQEDATPSQPDYVDFDCDEQTEQLSSSENTDDEEDVYEGWCCISPNTLVIKSHFRSPK